jgi:hypothetical protein
MSTELIIALVAIVLIFLGLGFWFFARRRTTEHLRERFGPEYDNAVRTLRSQQRAEAELSKREERVRKLNIVPLPRTECDRYRANWLTIQSRFVDEPERALADAYKLVQEVMRRCGYPVTDFEQSAADISVDHSHVVENYRAATRIADRSERSAASTEELRQALVHYRALFDDLLQSEEPAATKIKRTDTRIRKGKSSGDHPSH